MKQKLSLIIASILILIGVVKFDIFIYPTLDYFGKFVMVGALNIIPFWIAKMLFDRFQDNIQIQYGVTILWGVLSGVMLYLMG
jgi:hypothetical protein